MGEIVILQNHETKHDSNGVVKLQVPVVSLYNSHVEGLAHVSGFIKHMNTIFTYKNGKSMFTILNAFRDKLIPTTQYRLCAVPGITPAIVDEVRKSNSYRTSRDACTTVKGISNLWLTGMYGKTMREAYSAALRSLPSCADAIIKILVFESDMHLIDTRNLTIPPIPVEVAMYKHMDSVSSSPKNKQMDCSSKKVTEHMSTPLEAMLHRQLTVRLDDLDMSPEDECLAEKWMDMESYIDPLLTPEVVPMRLYTRIFQGRVCCFIRSEDGLLFATGQAMSVDEKTIDDTIDAVQTKTMNRFHYLQDAAHREEERCGLLSKRKREEEDASSKRKHIDIELDISRAKNHPRHTSHNRNRGDKTRR
jgi:hypothetical protein